MTEGFLEPCDMLQMWSSTGAGIHDRRAGGGSGAAGEEDEGDEQEAGGPHDQPKSHCASGECICEAFKMFLNMIYRLAKMRTCRWC